jgi:hypothetical protein
VWLTFARRFVLAAATVVVAVRHSTAQASNARSLIEELYLNTKNTRVK